MNRLYVHVSVDDLDGSVAFYRALFGFEPTNVGDDCAEWLLDDPALDFAITRRAGGEAVLTRLGLAMETPAELAALRERLAASGPADAGEAATADDGTDKHWALDPAGVLWEAYHTSGARLASAPSNRQYFEARRVAAATEHCGAIVRHRRLQRIRAGSYSRRPEARM